MVGKTLGHYEVIEPLGAGGMGEVYRARDTKLDRDVAIKVLPEDFAADAGRLARFTREAKLLASLSHPNIAGVYGLEDEGDTRFIAMELVEGETLANRIARSGRIDVDEALDIARQIAEALEAAHENGVIHRDLKPANVIVTAGGKAKVLDFGLAKASVSEGGEPGESVTHSPTATVGTTEAGVLLGTAPYMSPEQAKGKALDRRTDIWAFGCVMFEMLTGQRPFQGETVTETLAAVLKEEPQWDLLPADTPLLAASLLRRCLRKDSGRRMRDIGDARIEIVEAISEPGAGVEWHPPDSATRPWHRRPAPWLAAALVILAFAAGMVVTRIGGARVAPSSVVRFGLDLDSTELLASGAKGLLMIALSPDGKTLAYITQSGDSTQLRLRKLDALTAWPVPGTEGAVDPFFSPEGEWVGYSAAGKLMRVSVAGGPPIEICDRPQSRGAAWAPDGMIYFPTTHNSGIWRVSAAGGDPEPVTELDVDAGERSHRWPYVLPGGRALLFTTWAGGSFEAADVVLYDLETTDRRTLIEEATFARYSPTGHVVYARGRTLVAVPFDLETLEITGPHLPVVENVATASRTGVAQFSFSGNGTLAYLPRGSAVEGALVWVSHDGGVESLFSPTGAYDSPRLSSGAEQVAVTLRGENDDVWVHNLVRETSTRFTFGEGIEESPTWSPDGSLLAYATDRPGEEPSVSQRAIDGSSPEELLLQRESHRHLDAWAPDGGALVYTKFATQTGEDLWVLPTAGDREPWPLLQGVANESDAAFSPDGRYFAYASDESGQDEVYVQSYPDADIKWQISTDGGSGPTWLADGTQLFYRSGSRMMAVSVDTSPVFRHGTPEVLFEGQFQYELDFRRNYDVAPDGRFLMLMTVGEPAPLELDVVLNWFEELRRLVPASSSR